MKFLVVLVVAVACASADVSHVAKDESTASIVKSAYDVSADGSYQYSYETGNGISAESQGLVKNQNSEYPSQQVNGAFRYISPEGESVSLTYVADEFGFQPQGSHLPTPHPIPDAILRSLEFISRPTPPVPVEVLKGVPKPAYS